MTGMGITVLVLLLVIGIVCFALRDRLGDQKAAWKRKRADKGKVKCYHCHAGGVLRCKNKAGWVTPRGYFCDEHWEINSKRNSAHGKIRWANKLAWKRMEKTDVWTT